MLPMFCFKGMKAEERGGMLYFSKRRTSSLKYLVEFTLFPLKSPNYPNSSNSSYQLAISQRLFINLSFWRRISPFHIEYHIEDNTWSVMFEIGSENTPYELCWDGTVDGSSSLIVLCRFMVEGTDVHSLDSTSILEFNELFKKILFMIDIYPELCMFVGDLRRFRPTSVAWYICILLKGDVEFAKSLSLLDVKQSFENLPSLEECISSLLECLKDGNSEKIIQISQKFTSELGSKLTEMNIGLKKDTLFSSKKECGFLALCRLAYNGSQGAMALCKKFLSESIEREDETLISQLALTELRDCFHSYDSYTNIMYFLGELSVVNQNMEVFDELERELIYNSIFDVVSSKQCFSLFLPIYDHNYLESNYCNDCAASTYKRFLLSSSFQTSSTQIGHGISCEIFFNATILSKRGSKICDEFFQYFVRNMTQSTLHSLCWACDSRLPVSTIFQVYIFLQKDIDWFSPWIARKYFTGIEGLLPQDKEYGFKELVKLTESSSFLTRNLVKLSLGQLYLRGECGIPVDHEKALFWCSKLPTLFGWLQHPIAEYLESMGTKIEHNDEYFMNSI